MCRMDRPNAAREALIRDRMCPFRWGSDYLPGQLADRREAPDASSPKAVHSIELQRTVHLMSPGELNAFLLAMHTGRVKELHESRLLAPEPSPGPLCGYALAEGLPVHGHEGTIQIAERLGMLHMHPLVRIPVAPGSKKTRLVAYPLLGDLLLYLADSVGPYCVNWTIKETPEDFDMPFNATRIPKAKLSEAIEAQQARTAWEAELYRQVKTPSIHLANTDIPRHVALNLRQLYVHQPREVNLDPALRSDFIETLNARIARNVPVFETVRHMMSHHGGTMYDYQSAFYQAVWQRQIRVDLWTPINIDQPIHPEERDVVSHFSQWFKRAAP